MLIASLSVGNVQIVFVNAETGILVDCGGPDLPKCFSCHILTADEVVDRQDIPSLLNQCILFWIAADSHVAITHSCESSAGIVDRVS